MWWELWLKNRTDDQSLNDIAQQLAARIGAILGNTSINFFDSTVLLIKASVSQLEKAADLIANLVELRQAKETPNVIVDSSPTEQQQWAENLANRIRTVDQPSAAVCILDTGVNYNHQLLRFFINKDQAECWDPTWPHYDEYAQTQPYNDHGSRQSGIAIFGDVQTALLHDDEIVVPHVIESGRIVSIQSIGQKLSEV